MILQPLLRVLMFQSQEQLGFTITVTELLMSLFMFIQSELRILNHYKNHQSHMVHHPLMSFQLGYWFSLLLSSDPLKLILILQPRSYCFYLRCILKSHQELADICLSQHHLFSSFTERTLLSTTWPRFLS